MKRNKLIELTPLLDIILILLFVFIFNATNIETDKSGQIGDLQSSISELSQQIEELKIAKLQIEKENEELTKKAIENEEEIFSLESINDLEKETLRNIATAVSRLLSLSSDEFEELMEVGARQEIEEVLEAIESFSNSIDMLREFERYNEVSEKFYYVDILLEGENNKIVLNGQKTDIYITKYDISDERRKEKIDKIKTMVIDELSNREGGFSLLLVSYGIMDRDVYQFAYEILEESLYELRDTYGVNQLFLAEYNFIGGNENE